MKVLSSLLLIVTVLVCAKIVLVFLPLSIGDAAGPLNIKISPNGARVAVPTSGGISVYNAHTREKLSQFTETHPGKKGPPGTLTFSPDGSIIASAHRDRIYVWHSTTKRVLAMLDEHPNSINALALSPDKIRLATGSGDWTVRLWNVQTGTFLRSLTGHSSAVNAVAFSPDSKILASAGSTLQLWDTATGELQHANSKDLGSITLLVFSPDGKILATGGGWDFSVHLWNVNTGALQKTLKAHTGEIRDIAFSSEGRTLVTASKDKTLRLWDVNTGIELRRFRAYLDVQAVIRTGRLRKTNDISAAKFSLDGKDLIIASRAGTLHFCEVETGRYRQEYLDLKNDDD